MTSAASEPESVASALKTIEANRVSRIMDRLSAACTLGAGTQFNAVETASLRHHIRLLTYESVRPR